MKPSDVAGSDVQSIANLLKVVSYAGEAQEQQTELASAVDEYFKAKFRKLSGKEALQIVAHLAENADQRISFVDDKFWVWETLDEALRPIVSDLQEGEVLDLAKFLSANFKGSEDLWDQLHSKIYLYGRPSPF